MEKLKNNVWYIETLSELESDLDINDLFTSDYYLSSGDLSGIVDDMEYNGIELNRLIELTQNGYGGSQWTIYKLSEMDNDYKNMHILINNWI